MPRSSESPESLSLFQSWPRDMRRQAESRGAGLIYGAARSRRQGAPAGDPPMSGVYFTKHALERCRERGIDPEEVITALTSCRTRVQTSDDRSVTFAFRRLRIVCNAKDGSIVTVYRFNPVKRQLKKRRQDFQKYRQEDLHAVKF